MPVSLSVRRPAERHLLAALLAALLVIGLGVVVARTAEAVGPSETTEDPAATGPLGFQRAEYDLPDKVDVGLGAATPDSSTILAMRQAGVVYYPETGDGPFPVLIFQHGNHATCESGSVLDDQLLISPAFLASYSEGTCSTDDDLLDELLQIQESASYRGYDYLAQQLATQGYIVASLDINDITDWSNNSAESGYLGRAQIISKTLDLIGTWDTETGPEGIGDALQGRVGLDLGVGVMGHSRGGEGVNMFAEYNLTRPATAAEAATRMDPESPGRPQPVPDFGPRYDLEAVFSLAPVDGQGGRFPTIQATNWATALPYCDGDVFNLQGAPVFERSKDGLSASGFTAVQYLVNGANHNYFNTIWTADDANLFGLGDPNCNVAAGPTRLQPAEQRQVGLTIIGGFLRYWVGDETQFAPIVRGESLPPAVCPNGGIDIPTTVTCRNVIQTSYAAPERQVLLQPSGTFEAPTVPTTTPAGDPITATGLTLSACNPAGGVVITTTGCPTSPNRSDGPQLTAEWTSPTAELSFALQGVNADISDFGTFNLRLSPNYDQLQELPLEGDVVVTLTDATGAEAEADSSTYSAALETPPGSTARKQILNGVRIPLADFAGVDLTQVATISLGFGGLTSPTGSVQLNDVVLQEPAEPTPTPT
ncbi:hypothetical protein, partial [Nocardioides sp.]|uniref:hypothetical protein n=1 Tax=Nocardioides sp. TaxID=35761 RepID=UPI00260B7905